VSLEYQKTKTRGKTTNMKNSVYVEGPKAALS